MWPSGVFNRNINCKVCERVVSNWLWKLTSGGTTTEGATTGAATTTGSGPTGAPGTSPPGGCKWEPLLIKIQLLYFESRRLKIKTTFVWKNDFRCEPCKKIGSGKWRGMYMLWEDKGGRWVKDLEKGGICKESHFKLILLSHVTFESVYLGIHDWENINVWVVKRYNVQKMFLGADTSVPTSGKRYIYFHQGQNTFTYTWRISYSYTCNSFLF